MELLDRDVALCNLEIALEHAMLGEGRIALVRGEAGIGKTTLVDHFVRQHHARVRVLWGGCDALLAPRPLGPLHDIAEHIGGTLGELLDAAADAASRSRLFGVVLAELQRQPSIVVVEDIHWADEATLDVLRYVSRRLGRTSILLLLTYRADEVQPTHPLRTFVGDLASSATTLRIDLAPLSERAVATMVGQRAIDAAALHRQTGGNPFFVTEILADSGSGLPISIREAVLGRVARLSAPAATLVDTAAIAGPRVESWLLEAVLPAEFHCVEECLAAGVLVEHGDVLAFGTSSRARPCSTAFPPCDVRACTAGPGCARRGAERARGYHPTGAPRGRRPRRRGHFALRARSGAAGLGGRRASGRRRSAAPEACAARPRLPGADVAELLEARAMECYHVADMPGAIDVLAASHRPVAWRRQPFEAGHGPRRAGRGAGLRRAAPGGAPGQPGGHRAAEHAAAGPRAGAGVRHAGHPAPVQPRAGGRHRARRAGDRRSRSEPGTRRSW